MRRCEPGLRSRAILLALGLITAGCAAGTKPASPRFAVKAANPAPVFSFLWSERLGSWRYLDVEPKEYARPSHVGPTDELVVATAEGEVLKLQAANGEVLWRNRFEDSVFHAGPIIGQGRTFVADLEGNLRALDLQTGEEQWKVQLGNSVETRGEYSGGRVFVSTVDDVVRALDAETGKTLWTYSRELPEYFTVKGSCTPIVDRDVVYCGFSDGHLLALQIDSGDVVWDADLTGGKANFVDVDGVVYPIGNRIYAVSYSGGLFALQRSDGRIIWRQDTESAADFQVQGKNVFLASAIGRITAHDLVTGEPRWAFRLSESFPGSIQTFGPYVLVFTTDGPVYVLDGETGYPYQIWRGTTGFLAPVEPGSSRVYAMSNYGQLFGLKLGY